MLRPRFQIRTLAGRTTIRRVPNSPARRRRGVGRLASRVQDHAAAEDREDAQDTLGYQVRFTNALQTKLDKLAALAKANGVDAAAVDAIKNGPNL